MVQFRSGAGMGPVTSPQCLYCRIHASGLGLRSLHVGTLREVYRHSVMAQWESPELDVLLTPMLGPALDLNGPGKATGEAGSPITYLSPVSSFLSSALCLVGLLGSRRRGTPGEDSTPREQARSLVG